MNLRGYYTIPARCQRNDPGARTQSLHTRHRSAHPPTSTTPTTKPSFESPPSSSADPKQHPDPDTIFPTSPIPPTECHHRKYARTTPHTIHKSQPSLRGLGKQAHALLARDLFLRYFFHFPWPGRPAIFLAVQERPRPGRPAISCVVQDQVLSLFLHCPGPGRPAIFLAVQDQVVPRFSLPSRTRPSR